MSAFAVPSPACSRQPKPTFEDRLIARILARSLDRELAGGVPARATSAHAARARQLTTDRTRRAVANRLDRLVEQAERPTSRLRVTAAPCREHVRAAKDLIRRTATRLRSEGPVDALAIARLRTLLSDPAGPCYSPELAGALTTALRDISQLLDPPSHNL